MKRTILTLSAAIAALASGGIAIAQSPAPKAGGGERTISRADMEARAERVFTAMDLNGDGVIDGTDREARKAKRFAAMDADRDGEVSRAEIEAVRETRRQRHQARRDTRQADRFAALDTDQSGGLSQDELAAACQMRGARMGSDDGAREARKPGRRAMRDGIGRGGMQRGGMGRAMLRTADADGDRAITRAEFDTALMQRFARMDADGDGLVTSAERKAARTEMRRMRMRSSQS